MYAAVAAEATTPRGGDASSSTLYQDWWILLNTILRSCPDLQGWVQQQLYPLTARQKPGPQLLLLCFGPLSLGSTSLLPLRWKSLTLQGIKRNDDSALALLGRGKTAPVLLG